MNVTIQKYFSGLETEHPKWIFHGVFWMCVLLLLFPAACSPVEYIGIVEGVDSVSTDTSDSSTQLDSGSATESNGEDSGTISDSDSGTNEIETGDTETVTEDTGTPEDSGSADSSSAVWETDSAVDTATDTATDTDTDTDTPIDTDTETDIEYVRVPFLPVQVSDPYPMLVVPRESNELGVPGAWFPFPGLDFITGLPISNPYFDGDRDICVRGQVPQSSAFWESMYGGLGIGFCYDYNVTPEESFSFEECPPSYILAGSPEFDFIGVSFYVQGAIVPDDLQLEVEWKKLIITSEVNVEATAPVDYIVTDLPEYGDSIAPPNRIYTIQIQMESSVNHPVPFDFCIKDFRLLVSMK